MMRWLVPTLLLWLLPSLAVAQATLPHNIPDFSKRPGGCHLVASGQTYTLPSTVLSCVQVQAGGTAILAHLSTPTVGTLQILEGGTFRSASDGITATLTIMDLPIDMGFDPEQYGTGIVVLGTMRLVGQSKTPYVRLAANVAAGANTLALASSPSGWRAGDRLAIPDTHQWAPGITPNLWQNEVVTVSGVSGSSVTLSRPAVFAHAGQSTTDGSLTLRGHAGNLTRSITIKSANPNGTRGHILVTGMADALLDGVALVDLGRTRWDIPALNNPSNQKGRYALHAHMLHGTLTVKNSVVENARKWGLTLHGTNNQTLQNNVLYHSGGAGIMTEDGSETGNVIEGNLIIRTLGPLNALGVGHDRGDERMDQDDWGWEGSGIWLRGMGNIVRNNIVANSEFTNITIMPMRVDEKVKQVPIKDFAGNETYGAAQGITTWDIGSFGVADLYDVPASTFTATTHWALWRYGFYGYGSNRLTFDGWTHLGDRSLMRGISIYFGDYIARTTIVRNARVDGVQLGILTPPKAGDTRSIYRNALGTLLVEDSDLRGTQTGVLTETQWASTGGGDKLPGLEATFRRVLFPAGAMAKRWRTDQPIPNPHAPDRTFVDDFNRVPGDDFQVYYTEQRSMNVAGGPAPASATTRSGIGGLVVGGIPQTPPPPPPPPPPTPEPSPDGTLGESIFDAAGVQWSLSPTRAPDGQRQILRAGQPAAGGYGVVLGMFAKTVYTRNAFNAWYRWSGSNWQPADDPTKPVDPCVAAPLVAIGSLVHSGASFALTVSSQGHTLTIGEADLRIVKKAGVATWSGTIPVTDERGCRIAVKQ